ncbi:MAG: hypothetical protein WCT44_04030 [Candidatus Paceibacterota bacterium]
MKKKKIIITGDSGRGKSTLAQKLSKKLNIKHYSTDDFLWKTKYSEMEDKKLAEKNIGEIYKGDEWIVEGGSMRMLEAGLEGSDLIIYLGFDNILLQYLALIKRSLKRRSETINEFCFQMRHIFYKRYKLGYKKGVLTMLETLEPHKHKVIELNSYKQIDAFEL